LASVYDYIEAYGSDAALAWFQELEKAIYSLQRSPERGRCSRENKKRRILFFGRKPNIYKIIDEVEWQDAEVKVFHIRHGARRGSSG
jgi:plasmid stabilization system protein ParE